jgi:hypothetical protein
MPALARPKPFQKWTVLARTKPHQLRRLQLPANPARFKKISFAARTTVLLHHSNAIDAV